jgi:hypothetical protein
MGEIIKHTKILVGLREGKSSYGDIAVDVGILIFWIKIEIKR